MKLSNLVFWRISLALIVILTVWAGLFYMAIMEEVIKQEQCFSIKDLAINGKDIMSFGVPEGKIVGDTLQFILNMVISGDVENTIEAQMEEVKKYLDGKGVLV